MPHFMFVIISYIYLLILSWIIKCLFLRNMEPFKTSMARVIRYQEGGGGGGWDSIFLMGVSKFLGEGDGAGSN